MQTVAQRAYFPRVTIVGQQERGQVIGGLRQPRIAQLLVTPFAEVDPVEAVTLADSARGELGFGSSGVA